MIDIIIKAIVVAFGGVEITKGNLSRYFSYWWKKNIMSNVNAYNSVVRSLSHLRLVAKCP